MPSQIWLHSACDIETMSPQAFIALHKQHLLPFTLYTVSSFMFRGRCIRTHAQRSRLHSAFMPAYPFPGSPWSSSHSIRFSHICMLNFSPEISFTSVTSWISNYWALPEKYNFFVSFKRFLRNNWS